MADISLLNTYGTGTSVSLISRDQARIRPYIATAAITNGQAVYVDATGGVQPCSSAASGTKQFKGIALDTVGIGQATDVVLEGELVGWDLSGVAFDAQVFASDNAGNIATAAGTNNVPVGRVTAISDSSVSGTRSKCLYIRSAVALY